MKWSRRWSRRLLALAAAILTLVGSAAAFAQTVSITNPSVGHPDLGHTAPNRTTTAQNYISYSDCATPDSWVAYFTISSSTGAVDVWASEAGMCDTAINRETPTAGSTSNCYELLSNQPTGSGPIKLTSQQLVKAISTIPSGTCNDPDTSGTAHPLTIWFVATGTQLDPWGSSAATWTSTKIKLVGPPILTGYDLGAGDNYLLLSLATDTDPNLLGYYIYCSPSIADAGGGCSGNCTEQDAGVASTSSASSSSSSSSSTSSGSSGSSSSGTGGAGGGFGTGGTGGSTLVTTTSTGVGGSTAAAACADQIPGLAPGASPSQTAPICYQVNAGTTSVAIPSAADGTRYVIAIAAYDIVNNIGPLSSSLCSTPEPTNTFFGAYCRDGGAACPGCSQCSIGGSESLTWPALGSGALFAAAMIARRSRRSRRNGRSA